MTVSEWYLARQGQSLLVPSQPEADRGQCAQAANYALNEVYGLPYHYGNAIDWWTNPGDLLDSFDRVSDGTVKNGDFVIFNTKVGSQFGHIDIAMGDGDYNSFQGADSNWEGDKTLHLVQHTNASFILGTLRVKGDDMQPPTDQQVRDYFLTFRQEVPPQSQIDFYTSKDIREMFRDLLSSGQPKPEEVTKAFHDVLGTVPNADQMKYYPNRGTDFLYKDLAYTSKNQGNANYTLITEPVYRKTTS